MPVEQSKTCTGCGQTKPLTDFSSNGAGRKYRSRCKPCDALAQRLRHAGLPATERTCACGCGTKFFSKQRSPHGRFANGHYLRNGSPATRVARRASEAEIAWSAGIYEGEGYITSLCRPGSLRYTQMGINMTDEDILQRFLQVVNVGSITGPACREGFKPRWTWRAGRYEDIRGIMLAFAPWLGPRRLVQAVSALGQDSRGA